ncbi:MAG: PH domain-containing protein [bacterium]
MDEFEAPQDRFVQTATVLAVITFAVLFLIFAAAENTGGVLAAAVIGLLVLGTSYLFAPHGYTVGESGVVIHRKAGAVRIPFSRIRSVRQDPLACSLWGVRTFGVSGIFGYFGRFYTGHLGHHIRYATDRHRAVVIEADRTYVISPDDPQRFVRTVQARLEGKA